MGDPDDWAMEAAYDEAVERSGQEYFDQNWDTLLPSLSRDLIVKSATAQRATHRKPARAALIRADEAINRGDCAGAYFHIRRSVEGYAGALFTRPIFEYLNDAMGVTIPLFCKPMHAIFRDAFVGDLKRLSIRVIANDDKRADALLESLRSFFKSQPFRNDTFHSLYDPDIQVIRQLLLAANSLLDEIDSVVPRPQVRVQICNLDKLQELHWHGAACYKFQDAPEDD